MVGTIVPMVHGGTGKKKSVTAVWMYTLGCVIGAAFLGLGLGILGKILFLAFPGVSDLKLAFGGCGIVGLVYSLREVGIFKIPMPQICRQVPERRRHQMPNEKASLYYGIELGFGVVTRIPISSFYIIAIWALFTGNLMLSCLSVIGFGLGKAIPVMFLANSQIYVSGRFDVIRALSGWQRVIHYMNGLILCFVATILTINGLYR